jgi:L-threonylcarbamoyladenylate synthase
VQIEQACGQKLLSKEELAAHGQQAQQAPKASGTLESHYAPNATVRLMGAKALQTALDLLGKELNAPTIAVYARSTLKTPSKHILLRTMPNNAAAAAQELFAVLRELDAQAVKLIWVETPPAGLEWDGVRDRLQRASA